MSKTMKWIIAALAVSIAFNVFVIGVSIGKKAMTRGQQTAEGVPPGGPGFNARALGGYLDRGERRAVRRLIESRRDELRRSWLARRANEREIRELIVADQVDQERLAALLDANEQLVIATQHSPRRMMIEYIATLDAETRRAIAEDMFKRRDRRQGGPRPRGDGGRDRPPPPPRDGF